MRIPNCPCRKHARQEWPQIGLRAAGFDVTPGVGQTGVVGVLRNGEGPTVMLRADMDALPVREETGLPYASTQTATDNAGSSVPVMHACGHDMHVTWLIGAATIMAQMRDTWKGTLMPVFQPAEETGAGAQAMIDDGLMTRFPKPDVVLGQHVMVGPAGMDRRTCGRDYVGGRQPADSDVRTRRARVDAASRHRPGGHGRGRGAPAADDRVSRTRGH